MDVPVIDIGSWGASPADDEAISSSVDAACRSVGFLKISGHGIAPHLTDRLFRAIDGFFALPTEAKLGYAQPPEIDRGYTPPGREALAYSLGVDTPPDLFEAFNIGVGEVLGVDPTEDPLWAANVWPVSPPEFRATLLDYARAMYQLADRLLEIFAVALEIDRRWFASRADRSPDVLRLINYERRPDDPPPQRDQLRLGPHTDYGTCTVLLADPVPGLQILGQDDAWHDIVPTPGTLLVNIGDLLAAWTNDRWRSTLHRVIPPPIDKAGPARRRSAAYFHEANPDVIVEPLASCVDRDGPARYEPFSVGDHLTGKVVGPRSLTASLGQTTLGDRVPVFGSTIDEECLH